MVKETSHTNICNWVPIFGRWKDDSGTVAFIGGENSEQASEQAFLSQPSFGIALSGIRFSNGTIKATVWLPEITSRGSYGQILLGFNSWQSRWISVGISGEGPAFVVAERIHGAGWRVLESAGSAANLKGNFPYSVEVKVDGQRISLTIDSIRVLEHVLTDPLSREQVGLFAQGDGPVKFETVSVTAQSSSAFVVMQFTDQFDDLYDEVIRPVCGDLGIDAFRVSDIYRPGVILQDILQGLDASNVVIAEITTGNPNVFYELGYSHALKKPVVLLAERDTPLPFDISGYRVIFYDNTIGGKSAVEADLRRHLTSILGE